MLTPRHAMILSGSSAGKLVNREILFSHYKFWKVIEMKRYTGIMTALVTPLTAENTVDDAKMAKLVDFQIENGVSSLLVMGGTGEYSALTTEERVHAVESVVKASAGRVPVIAGVLDPGIGDAVKHGKLFMAAGADSLLVLTPYYVHPNQDGIIDFFVEFDRQVNAPIMIYNIPYRTYVNILPETVEKLVDMLPNLVGMKECSPSFGQAVELIQRVGDRISVLSGEEFLCGGEILLGADGAIMATANLIPDVWVKVYETASQHRVDELREVLKTYFPLVKLLFKEINPGPVKYAMGRIGVDAGCLSIPLKAPSDALKAEIDAEMKKLGIL